MCLHRASLYSLCVPSGFDVKAGFQVNISHIFPQGILAAVTLVGGKTEDDGTRARASCELMLPICLVAGTMLSQAGLGPKLLEQKS